VKALLEDALLAETAIGVLDLPPQRLRLLLQGLYLSVLRLEQSLILLLLLQLDLICMPLLLAVVSLTFMSCRGSHPFVQLFVLFGYDQPQGLNLPLMRFAPLFVLVTVVML